jgi:hypothetical protein
MMMQIAFDVWSSVPEISKVRGLWSCSGGARVEIFKWWYRHLSYTVNMLVPVRYVLANERVLQNHERLPIILSMEVPGGKFCFVGQRSQGLGLGNASLLQVSILLHLTQQHAYHPHPHCSPCRLCLLHILRLDSLMVLSLKPDLISS